MNENPENEAGQGENLAASRIKKAEAKLAFSSSGGKLTLLDITERIKTHNFGRDEAALFPVKEPKPNGASFWGVIRLGDGRYFSAGVWKHPRRHQLRLRLRTETPVAADDPQAMCFLERVSGDRAPHYRSAFFLDGKIYSVRLWVRAWGEKKVLELKLASLNPNAGGVSE